jgi:hypothetical protein
LKKPKEFYLLLDVAQKNKESICNLCVFLKKENPRFLGAKTSKLVTLRLNRKYFTITLEGKRFSEVFTV